MSGHVTNVATKLEDPMPIRPSFMRYFVLKIATFRYHGNRGLSETNLASIVYLADPENHTIEPKMTSQPELWQIFC